MTIQINIIGCGGIGSYFAAQVATLVRLKQLNEAKVTVFDFDEIELKNLMYQDYCTDDLYKTKAEVIAEKYNFSAKPRKVTKFDLVTDLKIPTFTCLCVDNVETRKIFFNSEDFKIQSNLSMPHGWIDMRCQGAQVAYYTKSAINTAERMLATLPEKQEEGTGSCQYETDLKANRIQQGNKIIAVVGSQVLLNLYRGEKMTSTFHHGF